jgi:hypothetical protein
LKLGKTKNERRREVEYDDDDEAWDRDDLYLEAGGQCDYHGTDGSDNENEVERFGGRGAFRGSFSIGFQYMYIYIYIF